MRSVVTKFSITKIYISVHFWIVAAGAAITDVRVVPRGLMVPCVHGLEPRAIELAFFRLKKASSRVSLAFNTFACA